MNKYIALYDPENPICTDADDNPVVWLNSDNWVTVTGTDCEEIAALIRDAINNHEAEPEK